MGTALTGLALVLFLALHLVGITLAPLAPERFEAYAAALHQRWWLGPLELGLAAMAMAHGLLALNRRWRQARARGPQAPAQLVSRRLEDPVGALTARTSAMGGLLLAGFLVLHLRELRWPRPAAGHELVRLQAALHQPLAVVLYCAAGLALAWHLAHGFESAHRSMGWLNPANRPAIRQGGRLAAVGLGLGFSLVTLALVLGGR